MPIDAKARGMAALSGFALFMTFIDFCYLNSTTSHPIWSLIYVGGIGVTILATASKWATALNVETKLAEYADKVASIIPIASLFFVGLQALHYNRDGLDGFMAGWSIGTFILLLGFGVGDAFMSWAGRAAEQASGVLNEASNRLSDINAAAHGRRTGTNN